MTQGEAVDLPFAESKELLRMNIAIVGTGYVGLVAGACLAQAGNNVVCVDIDGRKILALRGGEIPIYEPGLKDIVERNMGDGRLSFTTSLKAGVEQSEVVFIAVGTPQGDDGSADLRHVLAVAKSIGQAMNGPKLIVDKSTVPVGTALKVRDEIAQYTTFSFEVVSNPEFLKEGAAVDDFLRPDRVVVGVTTAAAEAKMRALYAPFVGDRRPLLVMDVASAEVTKYAANAMLATRISFMNEIALLCERTGASVDMVRSGIGTDARIGMPFLSAGCGYGGSCFPKDVQALIRTAKGWGVELEICKAVEAVNHRQKMLLVDKIIEHYGGERLDGITFGVWGLAFKPETDDVREAPALVIIGDLVKRGARVLAFDPEAMENFRAIFGASNAITYVGTSDEAVLGVDALVVCTEWQVFRRPDWARVKEGMRRPVVFDGRNLFSPVEMKKQGFSYYSIGRPAV